jgi:hypothetical protein
MPKFRNISVHDHTLPTLGGRVVKAGDVIDVSDDEAEGFAAQVGQPGSNWEAVGAAAKQAVKAEEAK